MELWYALEQKSEPSLRKEGCIIQYISALLFRQLQKMLREMTDISRSCRVQCTAYFEKFSKFSKKYSEITRSDLSIVVKVLS